MKYFLQFEGREKLLLKCIFVAQIAIIGLLICFCLRPNYLYIDDEQLKELYSWRANQNSEELRPTEKAKAAKSSD